MPSPASRLNPDSDGGRRGERGQAMVELVLVLPVLLIILIGVVQFALVYHAKDVATTAAQEGARLAAADGRTPAEGAARARDVLQSGLGRTGAGVRVTGQDTGGAVGGRARALPSLPPIAWGVVGAGRVSHARGAVRAIAREASRELATAPSEQV